MIHDKKKFSFNELFNILYKTSINAFRKNEVPVSALIFDPIKKRIISKSHNLNKKKYDPCAHAEIIVIQKACKKLKKPRLDGYDIYCSLEPCLMCSAVIMNSKIRRIYFAVEDKKNGSLVNNQRLAYDYNIKKKPKVYYGFNENDFSNILKKFFYNKR